jgi:hypothetical protein
MMPTYYQGSGDTAVSLDIEISDLLREGLDVLLLEGPE